MNIILFLQKMAILELTKYHFGSVYFHFKSTGYVKNGHGNDFHNESTCRLFFGFYVQKGSSWRKKSYRRETIVHIDSPIKIEKEEFMLFYPYFLFFHYLFIL
jgi:hypothetical protein